MNYKERKILILDDEVEIANLVANALKREQFTRIYQAHTIAEANKLINTIKPDLLILDVMLPDGSGFDLMNDARKDRDIPVIFLTAKDEDMDKLIGLGMGADDYITKPFLMKELLFRIEAVLHRTYSTPDRRTIVFNLGNTKVDMEKNLILKNDKEIPLTAKERAILLSLYENKNMVVTGDAICSDVWGDDLYGYEQTLMTHIGRIRKKIEKNPAKPQWLVTVKGVGYKLLVKED